MTQSQSHPNGLALSQSVLRILTMLNLVGGALILALLIVSIIAESFFMKALGVRPAADNSMLLVGMRLIMVLGICAVPVVHLVVTRLLAMVETVSVGNPFVLANATRLRTIAWAMLALELMHFIVGIIAATTVSSTAIQPNINWSLSLTRWLAVLMLFVLAQVFEQGARMREDLEGTV
jgi:hypothetical protein